MPSGKASRRRRPREATKAKQPETRIEFPLHPEPDKVIAEVNAARRVLKIDKETITVPEKLSQMFMPDGMSEALASELKSLLENKNTNDPDLMQSVQASIDSIFDDSFFEIVYTAARSSLSALGTLPSVLEFYVQQMGFELEDHRQTFSLAFAIACQADAIRRHFGISNLWPAERAILYGPEKLLPPFCGPLEKQLRKKSIATQAGDLVFGGIPVTFDDPRYTQYVRDELISLLARRIGNRPLGVQWYREQEDGSLQPVPQDSEELVMHQLLQENLPEFLRQPITDTVIPKRVIHQRIRDVEARRRRLRLKNPAIYTRVRNGGGRRNREK